MYLVQCLSAAERTVLLKVRVKVSRLDCLPLSVLLLKLRVKPLLWVYLVQCLSVAERKVLLKLRAKVSRSECLVQCLSVLQLELRVKALNKVCFVQ